MKSTVDEIRARFDAEVDRFSNLQTGQTATMDAPLALELVASAAAACTPQAKRVLDVGCGAGNYTLKLLERLPGLEATLIDLSLPMLQKAEERVRAAGAASVTLIQQDVRLVELGTHTCDIILASAVLHHLRTDAQWEAMFASFYRALAPGGSLWVFDLVAGASPELEALAWRRYGAYLEDVGGADYRDRVYAYIEREDTPRPLFYQLDLLRRAGWGTIEVLHKNACFAAYGGVKR